MYLLIMNVESNHTKYNSVSVKTLAVIGGFNVEHSCHISRDYHHNSHRKYNQETLDTDY